MTGGLDLMNYIRMRLFMALAQTPFHVTRWDEEPDLRHPRFKLWNVLPCSINILSQKSGGWL